MSAASSRSTPPGALLLPRLAGSEPSVLLLLLPNVRPEPNRAGPQLGFQARGCSVSGLLLRSAMKESGVCCWVSLLKEDARRCWPERVPGAPPAEEGFKSAATGTSASRPARTARTKTHGGESPRFWPKTSPCLSSEGSTPRSCAEHPRVPRAAALRGYSEHRHGEPRRGKNRLKS